MKECYEYQKVIDAKVAYFKDLDIDAVRTAQETIVKLKSENDNLRNSFMKADTLRSNLASEKKGFLVQIEGYEKEVRNTCVGMVEILNALMELRKDITH